MAAVQIPPSQRGSETLSSPCKVPIKARDKHQSQRSGRRTHESSDSCGSRVPQIFRTPGTPFHSERSQPLSNNQVRFPLLENAAGEYVAILWSLALGYFEDEYAYSQHN